MNRRRYWWFGTLGAVLILGSLTGYFAIAREPSWIQKKEIQKGDKLGPLQLGKTWKVTAGSSAAVSVVSPHESLDLTFPKLSGLLKINQEDTDHIVGTVAADMTSLYSEDPAWNAKLRDWYFFNVKAYPEASFRIVKVGGFEKPLLEGEPHPLTIEGELTVRNMTQPIQFKGEIKHTGSRMELKVRCSGLENKNFGIPELLEPIYTGKNMATLEVTLILEPEDPDTSRQRQADSHNFREIGA
ncbi:YceI family protein [Paenibacillus chitinolyticus]|uniref:YceI family protein n=1 Tax=Paenibacillus chitinolyticus TaxID=79263 RepID=UPI002DBCFA77|nr:YceI family protein [Paenibacillus chitinolyticus]MEC0245482.1 YceI family protein [Paenibacillus chitinolyticus]